MRIHVTSTVTNRFITGILFMFAGINLVIAQTDPAAGGSYDVVQKPEVSAMDNLTLQHPEVGDHALRIVSPRVLELQRINTKAENSATVDSWNFVDANGGLQLPSANSFEVRINGNFVPVEKVGFKRRVLSAPLKVYDVRIENALYLVLATAVPAGAHVEVLNPSGQSWTPEMSFAVENHPLRYSPAIHVNQEGYQPDLEKKAMVGYFLGNLGEMSIGAETGYHLVESSTGDIAFTGELTLRQDEGFVIDPEPYQEVYEADFSGFKTPGEYLLVVPGLGASLPFLIDDGVAMKFARTYALGLYHQRSGTPIEMPYTRFTHGGGHMEPAAVPADASAYSFTWEVIAAEANKTNSNNPAQIAPRLTKPSAQLYPFINSGPVDVSKGHHDAGDYSKYTTNSSELIHLLMFAVDSMSGVAQLDNLGLPESGDGISDILQMAKWEADFLAKMQDADGGFYFLVYPRTRRYESNVLPDEGDLQVVWPKTTAASAAAVAALAEIGSSPRFKAAYPEAAALYMEVAERGWQFLMEAIAKHGKAGAYQKITHYGDNYTHDDELAWAASAMFAATGDAGIHATLKSWYDPADPATRRWGWWRAYGGYGNAARTYAFAASSGRLNAAQLETDYLNKCQTELVDAGNDVAGWSEQNAYGTSFPDASKRVHSAGWYFSNTQAFDLAVAQQIEPREDYINAIIANLNFEAGTNPVNVSFLTGLGRKRQHDVVHQYAQNDRRVLPPVGIPQGNLQTGPIWTAIYGSELGKLSYPRDNANTNQYPLYDRWSDTFNVTTEFVHMDQARALATIAFLTSKTPLKNQSWKSGSMSITGLPNELSAGTPVTVGLSAPGFDLSKATIVWEAAEQWPAFGTEYTFTPGSYGEQWIEASVTLPDGRRLFAVVDFFADNDLTNVSVETTDAYATIGSTTETAKFKFNRDGDTTEALEVEFSLGGSAKKWSDYRRIEGDMPTSITIPAGASSYTMEIRAIDNSTGAKPLTLDVSVNSGDTYNAVSPRLDTAYLLDSSESTPEQQHSIDPVVDIDDSGFAKVPGLGVLWAEHYPWVYKPGMGWIYVEVADDDSLWLYFPPFGWLWTQAKEEYASYFYRYSDSTWIFYDSGEPGNRRFFNFKTKAFEEGI